MSEFLKKKLIRSKSTGSFYKNNTSSVDENISIIYDAGYTGHKLMTVNNKKIPYTEDRYINFSFDNNRYKVIGVTDGHGGSTEVSILVSGSIYIYLQNNIKKYDIINAILETFKNINDLIKLKKKKGGSTLTLCIIDNILKKAYIANLGDSVTQIFRKENNSLKNIFRTIDHDAENINEQKRIKEIYEDVLFEKNITRGYAIYAKYNSREIMVVGSFGDLHFPPNFIRKIPDINIIDLQKDDIIICSSDGYYETYNSCHNILGPGRDEQEIIDDLNNLNLENKVYNSKLIASDLLDKHLNNIVKLCLNKKYNGTYEYIYNIIKTNRDNNTLIVYTIL